MNQRAFRTLILWMIWAATALTVYVTLYSDSAVWEFIETDPSRITWLIIGLFLFGVVGSFILTLLLTLEWVRGLNLQTLAAQGGLAAVTVGSQRRAVDRFFHALKATVDGDGQPDVEAMLEVELGVFKRVSHSVEVIGNLLITLGLIGTVMGLTLTLTGLTGSLEALGHDQEMLLAGLRKAMAGMGTAFYTTLLGAVLGGVLLRVFAQITEHGVDSLYDLMMRLCLVYCSADYKPSLQRDLRFINRELDGLHAHAAGLREAFSASREAMNAFHEEVKRFHLDEVNKGEESLETLIVKHRKYCEVLYDEMRLREAIKNGSWWARFKSLFGIR